MSTSCGWEGKGRYGSFRLWMNVWVCTAGKTVKSLRIRAIPERICGGDSLRRGAISSVCTFTFTCRWRTTNVCDAWPVRRQTYGCLPSRKASLPIGWYQIILLGDRGTCVLTTCPGLHSTAGRPGFEPATCWSQVQHLKFNSKRVQRVKSYELQTPSYRMDFIACSSFFASR